MNEQTKGMLRTKGMLFLAVSGFALVSTAGAIAGGVGKAVVVVIVLIAIAVVGWLAR